MKHGTTATIVIAALTLALALAVLYMMYLNMSAPVVYQHQYAYGPQSPGNAGNADRPADRITVSDPLDVRVSSQQPAPPERPYVPTRAQSDFNQVGFIYNDALTVRFPMFGRTAPRNPNRWQYVIRADDADIRIGVKKDGRSCMDDIGCFELQTGDKISVPELMDREFTVTIYDTAISLTYRP